MSLDTLSFGIGMAFGAIAVGIEVYRGCQPRKIYVEHSREGISVQLMTGFGLGKKVYSNQYKIRPEEYDGRQRTDVLSEVERK